VQRRRWRRQPGVSHFHRLLCNIIFKTHRQPPPPPPKNPTAIYTLGRASNHARCCQLPFGRSVFVFFFSLWRLWKRTSRLALFCRFSRLMAESFCTFSAHLMMVIYILTWPAQAHLFLLAAPHHQSRNGKKKKR
jgi:hypothetical protein